MFQKRLFKALSLAREMVAKADTHTQCQGLRVMVPLMLAMMMVGTTNLQAQLTQCSQLTLRMGGNSEIEQLDCYQVKVPFYLETNTSDTTLIGYDFNFIIEFNYYATGPGPVPITPIEVVEVIIPEDTTECSNFNAGFGDSEIAGVNYFFISSPSSDDVFNPTTFTVNCATPSFYAVVEMEPGESFQCDTLSFPNNQLSYKLVNPALECDSFTLDFPVAAGPDGNSCNSTAQPLSIIVDVDNATNVPANIGLEEGQQKIIPIKLRTSEAGPLEPERIDFKISYEDVDGNLAIEDPEFADQSIISLNDPIVVDGEEGSVYVNMEYFGISGELSLTQATVNGDTVYEYHLFDLEVEAPINPPGGGKMDFSEDYARIKYDDTGLCCLPNIPSSSISLDEFKRPCQGDAPELVLIREETATDVEYTVKLEKGSSTDSIDIDDLYFEFEVFTTGNYELDESDTEASLNAIACPYSGGASCATSGYPADGCIEIDTAKNIIIYGMCDTAHTIEVPAVLFTIKIDKLLSEGTDSVRVNNAFLQEDNIAACAPVLFRCGNNEGSVTQLSSNLNTDSLYQEILSEADFCVTEGASACADCGNCEGDSFSSDSEGDISLGRQCGPISVSTCKSSSPLCAVSTADLIRIQRHSLGIQPFVYAWQYIAADVNQSYSITPLDLIQIRKLILSIDTEYAVGPNWRIIPCDFEVDGYTILEDYDDIIDTTSSSFNYAQLDCYSQDYRIDNPCFYGVKKGNVAFDVCGENSNPGSSISIVPENVTTAAQALDGKVAVGLAGNGNSFRTIAGFQLALRFDTTKLEFDEIKSRDLSYVDSDIYHYDSENPGLIKIAWYDEGGSSKSLDSTEYAMELVFDTLSSSISLSDIWIDTDAIPAEIFKSGGSRYELELAGGGGSGSMMSTPGSAQEVHNTIDVFNIRPNPVSGEFILTIQPAPMQKGRLKVFDARGQLVQSYDLKLDSTEHRLSADQWPSGLYYLQLEVNGESYTETLLKQ